jgi:hypothetical protein
MIRGNTHSDARPAGGLIMLKDAEGPRCYGFLYKRSLAFLSSWDAHLEYHDAANEGPDGMLRR